MRDLYSLLCCTDVHTAQGIHTTQGVHVLYMEVLPTGMVGTCTEVRRVYTMPVATGCVWRCTVHTVNCTGRATNTLKFRSKSKYKPMMRRPGLSSENLETSPAAIQIFLLRDTVVFWFQIAWYLSRQGPRISFWCSTNTETYREMFRQGDFF